MEGGEDIRRNHRDFSSPHSGHCIEALCELMVLMMEPPSSLPGWELGGGLGASGSGPTGPTIKFN